MPYYPGQVSNLTSASSASRRSSRRCPAPLRIEFSGATYHMTWRGSPRESIFREKKLIKCMFELNSKPMSFFSYMAIPGRLTIRN